MIFQFKVGDIVTDTQWNSPTFESFNKWYSEWRGGNDLSEYKVHLVGGFAEKLMNPLHNTMDVDIVLTGEIHNYNTLKSILNDGMALGFKHNLLIDISWVNEAVWNQHISIRKGISVNPNQEFTRIRTFYKTEKTIQNNTTKVDFSNWFKVTEIINGLYRIDGFDEQTTNKVIKHMSGDIYKGIYMELGYVAR